MAKNEGVQCPQFGNSNDQMNMGVEKGIKSCSCSQSSDFLVIPINNHFLLTNVFSNRSKTSPIIAVFIARKRIHKTNRAIRNLQSVVRGQCAIFSRTTSITIAISSLWLQEQSLTTYQTVELVTHSDLENVRSTGENKCHYLFGIKWKGSDDNVNKLRCVVKKKCP